MTQILVGKWGNNLAVRLPGEIVQAARLRDGERVEIVSEADAIVIRRIVPQTLDEMFRGKTAEGWRADYAGAFDWGPDAGREIITE